VSSRPLLALAAALALSGCAGTELQRGEARKGGSITVALPADPGSLDPATASTPEAHQVIALTHLAPLTYARAEGAAGTRLIPALAEEVPEPSDEGRRFVFTFRQGLRFPAGRALTGEDFETALERSLRLDPEALRLFGGIRGARRYARSRAPGGDLAGVTAEGRSVRIELLAPDPLFPYALASPRAAPVPAGSPSRELATRPPPGIGPYVNGDPARGAAFVLQRRRDFELSGVPNGNVDVISGESIPSPAAASRAAIGGRVDAFSGQPPVERLVEIRSKYKDRYGEEATLALDYLAMDVRRRPFRDEEMRRAVSLALDLRTLGRLSDGFLEPACNAIPAQVPGYRRLDPCPYGERQGNPDLVRARELVQEADGRPPLVRVVAPARDPRASAKEAYLVATLRKIGIPARRARTPAQRARPGIGFARLLPSTPLPARYLEAVDDFGLESRIRLLERDGLPSETAEAWADLDRNVVELALIVPYGVEQTGVLLSERMDPVNCRRFHPVYGLDWSSLCLR
jgi:peptide/nickel transport system substrate-binding protein